MHNLIALQRTNIKPDDYLRVADTRDGLSLSKDWKVIDRGKNYRRILSVNNVYRD